MNCMNCGSEIKGGEPVCPVCGAPVADLRYEARPPMAPAAPVYAAPNMNAQPQYPVGDCSYSEAQLSGKKKKHGPGRLIAIILPAVALLMSGLIAALSVAIPSFFDAATQQAAYAVCITGDNKLMLVTADGENSYLLSDNYNYGMMSSTPVLITPNLGKVIYVSPKDTGDVYGTVNYRLAYRELSGQGVSAEQILCESVYYYSLDEKGNIFYTSVKDDQTSGELCCFCSDGTERKIGSAVSDYYAVSENIIYLSGKGELYAGDGFGTATETIIRVDTDINAIEYVADDASFAFYSKADGLYRADVRSGAARVSEKGYFLSATNHGTVYYTDYADNDSQYGGDKSEAFDFSSFVVDGMNPQENWTVDDYLRYFSESEDDENYIRLFEEYYLTGDKDDSQAEESMYHGLWYYDGYDSYKVTDKYTGLLSGSSIFDCAVIQTGETEASVVFEEDLYPIGVAEGMNIDFASFYAYDSLIYCGFSSEGKGGMTVYSASVSDDGVKSWVKESENSTRMDFTEREIPLFYYEVSENLYLREELIASEVYDYNAVMSGNSDTDAVALISERDGDSGLYNLSIYDGAVTTRITDEAGDVFCFSAADNGFFIGKPDAASGAGALICYRDGELIDTGISNALSVQYIYA